MQLRIDTEGVAFFCTKPPEPKVDFETGVVKADRDSGEHLWRTQLAAVDPTGGEIVQVTVAGEPHVAVGAPVQVTRGWWPSPGLRATARVWHFAPSASRLPAHR